MTLMKLDGRKLADMEAPTCARRLVSCGNSISAQKSGFFPRLCAELSSQGDLSFENASVGGVGTMGVTALSRFFLHPGPPGVAIVETSASDAAGATPLDDLSVMFNELLDIVVSHGLTPLVVHLPRFDLSEKQLAAVTAIQDQICASRGVTALNLRSALLASDTHDGVHLTDSGAQRVAGLLLERVREMVAMRILVTERRVHSPSIELRTCAEGGWNCADGQPGSFRLLIPTRRFVGRECTQIGHFPAAVLGLVAVVGPSSGAIHVVGSQRDARIQLWDEWSTFRRLQVVHLPRQLRHGDSLTISLCTDGRAEIDAWGTPCSIDRIGESLEIVGLITHFQRSEDS